MNEISPLKSVSGGTRILVGNSRVPRSSPCTFVTGFARQLDEGNGRGRKCGCGSSLAPAGRRPRVSQQRLLYVSALNPLFPS